MTHKRLVSTLNKKGFETKISDWSKDRKMNIHYFTESKDGLKVLEWFASQDDSEVTITCRRKNDVSDMQSDYHAGFFARTMKQAVSYIEGKELF